jgi:SAM-dependent methyltransferase
MTDTDLPGLSEHEQQNRAAWDADADDYQARHGRDLADSGGLAWGTTLIPEAELRVLGDVVGKDILELGCGAAQWSTLLARRGARLTGVDNSERQLEHARRLIAERGVEVELVHASAESVPLPDASFDVVFCDHGAMSFADPARTVPEAARLLRAGGLLAFSHTSPIRWICYDEEADRETDSLQRPYFGMRRHESYGAIEYDIGYGEWIRLFRASGLVVEDLLEPQPPEGATSTYGWDPDWARKWPAECIWRVRKP